MKTTKVRIHPIKWFTKNCYLDNEGDFWENKPQADLYFYYRDSTNESEHNTSAELNAEKYFYCGDTPFEEAHGNIVDAENYERKSWEWAVQEYITKEKYPEYYL